MPRAHTTVCETQSMCGQNERHNNAFPNGNTECTDKLTSFPRRSRQTLVSNQYNLLASVARQCLNSRL